MDPEADPKEIGSLKHHAQGCVEYFNHLSQHEETGDNLVAGYDAFWASRQSAEFNLWCAKVGIFAEGQRSLDVRLKDVPEICDLFLLLLQSLHQDLGELIHGPETIAHPGKAESDNGDDSESKASSASFDSLSSSNSSQKPGGPDGVLSPEQKRGVEIRQHVVDTINRLQGQAGRIEHAGARHRRRRVEVYRKKVRPQQLYETFRQLGMWKAKQQFESASAVTVDRMAESFARRRIRFAYLQEHQKKRAVDSPDPPNRNHVSMVQDNHDNAHSTSMQQKEVAKPSDLQGTRHAGDQQTLLSATVHTTYDLLPEPRKKERAESVRSIALRHPGFPPPPETKDGRFQCPYCILEFRDTEAVPSRWKQHVMQDFEPYFCTFDGCESPFDVPNSFEGLVDHMQSHLPLQHHLDEPDREHNDVAELDFEHHVKRHGGLSLGTLDVMKESSRRKLAYLFDSCPFCGGYPDIVEKRFPDPDTIDAQVELRNHIKQHMQEIALFLPPYRSDIFEQDDDSKRSDTTHQRSSHDDVGTEKDDFVLICDNPYCDCQASSNLGSEDLLMPEFFTEAGSGVEPRWTCCLCGNNYKGPATHTKCTYQRCNEHQPCHNCDRYEYEYSHEGDWSFWLGATSVYDRSMPTYDEQLPDDRLHPFILHLALYEPRDPLVYPSSEGTPKERTGIVRELIRKYTRLHYQDPDDNSQPSLPSTDPVINLEKRLLSKKEEEPESRCEPDYSKVKEFPFKDISPCHGDRFLDEIDDFGIVRTEAIYREQPVWIEWFLTRYSSHYESTFHSVHRRAQEIVFMLRGRERLKNLQGWRVPPCQGYFVDEDEGRIGLVFEKPASVDPKATIITLRRLFTSAGFSKPSVEQRVRIMRTLHSGVESFHLNGLTHQGLRPDSVFFFVLKDRGIVPESDPYVSGFGYPEHLTYDQTDVVLGVHGDPGLALYQHPRHLPGEGLSRRSDDQLMLDDLYSLGVVLLEIASWKPITHILGYTEIDANIIPSIAMRAHDELLSDGNAGIWVYVRSEFGDAVTSAIRACIMCAKTKWPETEEDGHRSALLADEAERIQPMQGSMSVATDRSLHSPGPGVVANVGRIPAESAPASTSQDHTSPTQTEFMSGTGMYDEDNDGDVFARSIPHQEPAVHDYPSVTDFKSPHPVDNVSYQGRRSPSAADMSSHDSLDKEESVLARGRPKDVEDGNEDGFDLSPYRGFPMKRSEEQLRTANSKDQRSNLPHVDGQAPPGRVKVQASDSVAALRPDVTDPGETRKPGSRVGNWLRGQWPKKKTVGINEGYIHDILDSLVVTRGDGDDLPVSSRLGLNVLHQPESALVDIIFVHGIGGHSQRTWSRYQDPSLFWPKCWLPFEPGVDVARIMTFGYNANFYGNAAGQVFRSISDIAKDLLHNMRRVRDATGSYPNASLNPIIFVAHSTGGLIVKKAYLLGMQKEDYKHILDSVSSIIFLSTPHRGSNLPEVLRRILTASGRAPNGYIADVNKSSAAIEDLNEQFRQSAWRLSTICSFYETLPTSIGLRKAMVVAKESSVLGYPGEISKALNADHQGVCKYSSRSDSNYISVRNVIQQFVAQSRSKAERAQSSSVGSAIFEDIWAHDSEIEDLEEVLVLST